MTEAATARRPALPVAFRLYALLVASAAMAFFPAGSRAAAGEPLAAVLWVTFIAVSSLFAIPVLPRLGLDVSLSAPLSVSAAVVLSPSLALLVNALGFTSPREWRREATVWASLFNRGQIGLSAGAASLVANHTFLADLTGATGLLVVTLAALVVHNVLNDVAIAISLWTRRQMSLQRAAVASQAPIPRFAIEFGLVGLLSLLIVITHEQVGPPGILLLALPMGLGYSAIRSARVAEDRAEELADRVRELETLNRAATELLTARHAAHAAVIARTALRTALDTDAVVVSLDGSVSGEHHLVKVPEAEPAAVGVPPDLPERPMAVVEAIAGLLGMTLQRQELELELQEVQRARAALAGRILEEGTRERSRMAIDIHDEVLPFLAAAEIQADNVRSALQRNDMERADRLIATTRDAVHDGIRHLRQVIEDLRKQVIVPGGLVKGLRETLDELKIRHGLVSDLEVPDDLPDLPLAVEILLLETARGCLTNVTRHARAEHASLRLRPTDTMMVLEVIDDGRGFDPATVPEGHHGLALMGQRVGLARGRFLVDSAAGKGTCVRVEVPL